VDRGVHTQHSEAEVLAHPECKQNLLDLADSIVSITELLLRADES